MLAREQQIAVELSHLTRLRTPSLVISGQQFLDTFCLEACSYRLVSSTKDDPIQAVEFLEPDLRRWVSRRHADDRRFDQRWWTKVGFRDVHDVFDGGEQLNVG